MEGLMMVDVAGMAPVIDEGVGQSAVTSTAEIDGRLAGGARFPGSGDVESIRLLLDLLVAIDASGFSRKSSLSGPVREVEVRVSTAISMCGMVFLVLVLAGGTGMTS